MMNEHFGNVWAQKLGLVATPLFGRERANSSSHLAMLDGVRASFLFSQQVQDETDITEASDWAWSSNVHHHVYMDQSQIIISRLSGKQQIFKRKSVEDKLPEFLRFLELDSDRQKTASAVDHLIRLFRRHRATLRNTWKNNPPELESFLYLLALAQEEDAISAHESGKIIKRYALSEFDTLRLHADYVVRFIQEMKMESVSGRRLFSHMAIRHAGGSLFQEAHAEIFSDPVQLNLFGLADAGRQKLNLASLGVFYTPPGLARSLTEIAIEPHLSKKVIRIHDPACGSGIFLCEAIKYLQRRGYTGRILLSGTDVSAPAIQMARFSIACALFDWKGHKANFAIAHLDFFDALITNNKYDVILMNPPFRSWESLSSTEKGFVRDVLEDNYAGRPDLSMAFVQESLTHLAPNGTLATLLPRGALDSQGGDKWRQGLLRKNDVRLIGTFADHGLFRHAMVSIGAMVFERTPSNSATAMIWADEKPNSADEALRALRRITSTKRSLNESTSNWSIYSINSDDLSSRRNWLPIPNALGDMIDVIKQNNPTKVADLFTVRQGIKTGLREAFTLSDNEVGSLPDEEQVYFRKVASGSDIIAGRIFSSRYMFFAPNKFASRAQLLRSLPQFSKRLLTYEKALKARRSSPNAKRWWEVARPRADLAANTPRILTKMFGGPDMAAVDARGLYLPMQAFAWMPTELALRDGPDLTEATLFWYCRILNSKVFYLLRREFSATITAGGQLDVSPRFVDDVPLPTPSRSELLALASVHEPDLSASQENDEIVATSYGTRLADWPMYGSG